MVPFMHTILCRVFSAKELGPSLDLVVDSKVFALTA